jgi:UDP-2,3-diacylglucosamine hydrolase
MALLFISDLHLSQERPNITELFIRFLNEKAPNAEALYILGDLFEVWLGDDMILPEYQQAIEAIKKLSSTGTPVYIMYGNRDFLMRQRFEELTGATLIHEPYIIKLHAQETLLLHGDTLCTDDIEYQKLRSMVRNPQWQNEVLAKTPPERLALARQFRELSKNETAQKDNAIMDVNQQTVEHTMRENKVFRLIHGHTHRPGIHTFPLDDHDAERIVLGDWYTSGNYLECDNAECRLNEFN